MARPSSLARRLCRLALGAEAPRVLRYGAHGKPADVLRLEAEADAGWSGKDGEVSARLVAAPVNPADVNAIEGRYPGAPQAPAVGGLEGLFEVQDSANAELARGTWGVALRAPTSGPGTWRTHAVFPRGALVPIGDARSVDPAFGATLKVSFATAYRLLKDFRTASSGSVVITGATSHVGRAALQLCAAWNIPSLATLRGERPPDSGGWDAVHDELTTLGGGPDLCTVVPYGSLREAARGRRDVVLSLDGVGGDAAREAMHALADGGVHVVYGGMARQPVSVGAGALIFRDLSVRGFWMTRWYASATTSDEDISAMFAELTDMHRAGQLRAGPTTQRPFAPASVCDPSRNKVLLHHGGD